MGGAIKVIIREKDGKVHKMIRWTNQLPYLVKNPKFLNRDKEWLDKYISGKVFGNTFKKIKINLLNRNKRHMFTKNKNI